MEQFKEEVVKLSSQGKELAERAEELNTDVKKFQYSVTSLLNKVFEGDPRFDLKAIAVNCDYSFISQETLVRLGLESRVVDSRKIGKVELSDVDNFEKFTVNKEILFEFGWKNGTNLEITPHTFFVLPSIDGCDVLIGGDLSSVIDPTKCNVVNAYTTHAVHKYSTLCFTADL